MILLVSSAYNTSLIYCLVIWCLNTNTTEDPAPLRSRAIRRLVLNLNSSIFVNFENSENLLFSETQGRKRGLKGAIPDFCGQSNHHQAKGWAQGRAHWRAPDLFVDGCADRELCHLEGHDDDGFHIFDVDFPGHIQNAAGTAFDDVAGVVARGGFDRDDLVRVSAHCCGNVVECKMPTVDETLGVDTREKACKVLVV